MTGIVVKDLSVSLGDRDVLSDVSCAFPEGEITCIMGPSGCGKTTLLRCIAGCIDEYEGVISGVPDNISFVFQDDRLCEDHDVYSNIKLVADCGTKYGRKRGENRNALNDRIMEHLRKTELTECAHRPVRELSGGMKRRVAIVRAMCLASELVLLDEPFKGLDTELKTHVMDYIKNEARGRTVICVTHEESEAQYLDAKVMTMPFNV